MPPCFEELGKHLAKRCQYVYKTKGKNTEFNHMEMKIYFGRNIMEGKCNRLGLHCDHIDDHKKDDNPNNTQEKDTFIATQTFGNSRDLTF